MIQNRIGPSVERENFYGRKEKIDQAWLELKDRNSLVISAPRRVGKTSFAKKMMELAEQQAWKSVYLDIEGLHDEKEFAQLLSQKLEEHRNFAIKGWNNMVDYFQSLQAKISTPEGMEFEIKLQKQIQEQQRKVEKLLRNYSDFPLIIVIDELAVFLNALLKKDSKQPQISRVEKFMEWLRSLRMDTKSHQVWIFCSSIGIETFMSVYELSNTINDLHLFKIDALPPEEAMGLLSALCESYQIQLTEDVKRYVLDQIDWAIPYYIQLIFGEIRNLGIPKNVVLSTAHVDQAYQRLLIPHNFSGMEQHFKQYPQFSEYQKNILSLLAKNPDGLLRNKIKSCFMPLHTSKNVEGILTQCLQLLQDEGYIICNEKHKYQFRCKLFRDYWKKKYII